MKKTANLVTKKKNEKSVSFDNGSTGVRRIRKQKFKICLQNGVDFRLTKFIEFSLNQPARLFILPSIHASYMFQSVMNRISCNPTTVFLFVFTPSTVLYSQCK